MIPSRLTTIFLDAGGVLVRPNWDRVAAALQAHGLETDPGTLGAAEPYGTYALDTAATVASTSDEERWLSYFHAVLRRAGIQPCAASRAALEELQCYHAAHNLWETVCTDASAALAQLRSLGMRLVVVSNANGRLRHSFVRLGLDALVDVIIDSHEEHVEKPDPRLFRIALERSGAPADATLHVGDLYHVDVVGAEAAGIEGVLLDRAGLYGGTRCPRVASLTEFADLVAGRRGRT